MALKILAIVMLVACGLLLAVGWLSAAGDIQVAGDQVDPAGGGPSIGDHWQLITAFAAALVPVMFAYGGSHTTTFMAGEVRDPMRTMPRTFPRYWWRDRDLPERQLRLPAGTGR